MKDNNEKLLEYIISEVTLVAKELVCNTEQLKHEAFLGNTIDMDTTITNGDELVDVINLTLTPNDSAFFTSGMLQGVRTIMSSLKSVNVSKFDKER